jgi:glucokinase
MWILAGDIGGTKTSIRLAECQNHGEQSITAYEALYTSASYSSFDQLLQEFWQSAAASLGEMPAPLSACFGMAGPVVDHSCRLTNLDWFVSAEDISNNTGIPQVILINDFTAVGYGLLGLERDDLFTLQEGKPKVRSPIAVIGAGTGLGECFLTWSHKNYEVHPTEGGHSDFAPRSPQEIQLLQYLQPKIGGNVSVERIVSGMGIVAIYQFLRDSLAVPIAEQTPATIHLAQTVASWEAGQTGVDAAALIAAASAQGQDGLAAKTMEMFVAAYGAEAGNLALTILPYGGLYIAGGVAAKNLDLMRRGSFLEAFLQKGRMRSLLAEIPIHIVLNPQVGLIGATLHAAKSVDFDLSP